jgi:tetratricopeptide (TPR) repeat protein
MAVAPRPNKYSFSLRALIAMAPCSSNRFFPHLILGLALCWAGQAAAANLDTYEAMIDDGWAERARAELGDVVGQKKANARAHFLYAKASLRLRDYETADKHSEKAVKLEPDNATYQLLRGDSVGLRARHGSKVKAISRAKKCIAAYRRAAELEPDNLMAQISVFAFSREAPGYAGGDKDRARAQLAEIARIKPMWGYFFRSLWAIEQDQDPETAQRELFDAMAAWPDHHEPYDEYAKYLLRGDQPDSVVHYYRLGLARNPEPAPAHVRLGHILMNQKRYAEAAEEFAAALAADPTYLPARIGISVNFQEQKQWDEALNVLTALETAHPDYHYVRYQRARTLMLCGRDLKAAEAEFRAYLKGPINTNWPDRAATHWRLALTLEKRGNVKAAYTEAQTAVKLGPGIEQYKKEKDRLEFLAEDEL